MYTANTPSAIIMYHIRFFVFAAALCTPWPSRLPHLPLRTQTRNYIFPGQTIKHPGASKVVLTVSSCTAVSWGGVLARNAMLLNNDWPWDKYLHDNVYALFNSAAQIRWFDAIRACQKENDWDSRLQICAGGEEQCHSASWKEVYTMSCTCTLFSLRKGLWFSSTILLLSTQIWTRAL